MQGRRLLVVRLANDDGQIAAQQRGALILGEFDRAWTIEEGIIVAEIAGGGGIKLDAHAVAAGFRRRVADGRLVRHPALARNGAGAKQDRFEETRLAA